MLINPTMDHLKDLRLSGMLEAYARQLELPENVALTFEERFSLIVDHEWNKRRTTHLNKHIRRAGFREEALKISLKQRNDRIINRYTRRYVQQIGLIRD
jgi:hypothetical protein